MKAAFLDRDGTIVSDYPDETWSHVSEPEFLAGAREGLESLIQNNFKLIIVTNQYLIDEGFITLRQYEDFTARMLATLKEWSLPILDIFHCPHRRDSGCRCCKPRPGMIEAALERYPEIKIESSLLAGDRPTDITLADHFGLRSFGIGFDAESPRCQRVESLREIAPYLW